MTDANLDIEFDSLLTHFTDITFDGVTAKLITIYSFYVITAFIEDSAF